MTKKISRRKILKGAAIAASIPVLTPTIAFAKKRTRLRMVTSWPKNFPGVGVSAESIAKKVKEMSNGELEIKVYSAGELVSAFEAFDAVSTGTADIYSSADYYWQGKDPAFAFFTTFPLGMTAIEFSGWLKYGGGQELWDELTKKYNTKSFAAADTGTQAGGWFNREINTINDFKGLKMRVPGLGGEVIRRLGGTPVILPGSELYPSLQSGAIDAAEWIGPWNDLAFGFHQIAKYFYSPGFLESNGALSIGVNRDMFANLPAHHQSILTTAFEAQYHQTTAEYYYKNTHAFQDLVHKHKVEVRQFSPEIIRHIRKVVDEVMQELSQKTELCGRIYKSVKQHIKLFDEWSPYAEERFLKYRNRNSNLDG